MNFIQRLQDENKTEDLINAFKNVFGDEYNYSINFFYSSGMASLDIDMNSHNPIARYIIKDYDLYSRPTYSATRARFDKFTEATSRKIYLTFMKNTFPEYAEECAKHYQAIVQKKLDELNSL